MSSAADLKAFLIAEVEEGNSDFVTQLLDLARAKILAGGGEIAPLERGSLMEDEFAQNVRMDAAEVAAACREALRYADANYSPITFVDFSRAFGVGAPPCPPPSCP